MRLKAATSILDRWVLCDQPLAPQQAGEYFTASIAGGRGMLVLRS
jgi:hypothetical protein